MSPKIFALVLLSACTDTEPWPAESSLPEEQAGPPLSTSWLGLAVSSLDAREQVVLAARGADPGATVYFLRGSGYGPGDCHPAVAPSCLQIQPPVALLAAVRADAAGNARHTLTLPNVPAGRTVAFQAVTANTAAAAARLSEAQVRVTRPRGATDPYGVGPTFEPVTPTLMAPNALIADTLDLAVPSIVTGLVCQGRALGGFFKATLYDDVGDFPGSIVAQGPIGTISVGPNRVPNLSPPTVLPAGRYWLAVVFESVVSTWENGLSPDSPQLVKMHNFYSPMADPWVGGTPAASPRLACFIEVQ